MSGVLAGVKYLYLDKATKTREEYVLKKWISLLFADLL